MHFFFFAPPVFSVSTSGKGKCNAWMETTIIHQLLFPPISLSPASGFLRDILFTRFDLFSTDMQ